MIHVSLGSDENRQKHSFQKRSPGKYVCMFFIPDQPASKASKWEAKGEPSYPASSFPLTSGRQTNSSRQASMRSKGGRLEVGDWESERKREKGLGRDVRGLPLLPLPFPFWRRFLPLPSPPLFSRLSSRLFVRMCQPKIRGNKL